MLTDFKWFAPLRSTLRTYANDSPRGEGRKVLLTENGVKPILNSFGHFMPPLATLWIYLNDWPRVAKCNSN